MIKKILLSICIFACLLSTNTAKAFTHADTLRGSNGRGRNWWKVTHYNLAVQIMRDSNIAGQNTIRCSVITIPSDSMQIDLDSTFGKVKIMVGNELVDPVREGKVIWVKYPFHNWAVGTTHEVTITYYGRPRLAVRPPWDGGFSWSHDKTGKPWISVSCQGLGASAWWPCKDAQWEEPDSGMDMHFGLSGFNKLSDSLAIVSNGRIGPVQPALEDLVFKNEPPDSFHFWNWHVVNPINNYDVTFYIGDYIHWHDTLMGEKGILDLDFWVLRYNEEKARKQFAVVKQMIHCFEYWMGPYPFYEDGYKLVEAPYLGMEHQGAIAYGNDYKMGYKGFDRTFTGIGMNFDYIIVHESGHEWFGNNITAKDIADNWIHEGITTYSETLFTECLLGKEKADRYNIGEWLNIENDKPIIGNYGVNDEGSNDMYDKGSAIMHMIRTMTNDDEKFRQMLRGLTATFYHKTVTTAEVETYIATQTSLDLVPFFNQYLRTTNIPKLEYYIKKKQLHYRFTGTVSNFTLPLQAISTKVTKAINPTSEWQSIKWKGGFNIKFSKDFLLKTK